MCKENKPLSVSRLNSQRLHQEYDGEKPHETLPHWTGTQTPLVSLFCSSDINAIFILFCLTSDIADCRIAGNAAKDVNIYQSVCEQMARTFAKSKWKVSDILSSFYNANKLTAMQISQWRQGFDIS